MCEDLRLGISKTISCIRNLLLNTEILAVPVPNLCVNLRWLLPKNVGLEAGLSQSFKQVLSATLRKADDSVIVANLQDRAIPGEAA